MNKPSDAELASVPEAVRRFMDGMLRNLDAAAKRAKLELYAYHYLAPGHTYWIHNLFGAYYGWRVTVQVYVNEDLARERRAKVLLHVSFAWPVPGSEWVVLAEERAEGVNQVLQAILRLADHAADLCGLRLPRAGTPNGLA